MAMRDRRIFAKGARKAIKRAAIAAIPQRLFIALTLADITEKVSEMLPPTIGIYVPIANFTVFTVTLSPAALAIVCKARTKVIRVITAMIAPVIRPLKVFTINSMPLFFVTEDTMQRKNKV